MSCEKETIIDNSDSNISQNKTEGIDLSQVSNYLDGQLILDLDTLERFGDDLISVYDGGDNLIYNFSTKENFYNWVKYRPNGSKIIKIDEAMDFLSDYAEKSGTIAYNEQTGEILEEYQLVSDSIANLFVAKEKNLYTVLYDGTVLSGSNYQLILTFHPTFGSFNNKAESAQVYLCLISTLCDKTWFRGSRFYFLGFNGQLDDLGNWRNKAESSCLL
jgi:hypothetical protein